MLSSKRNLALACTLSALAGYVDGVGFLHLGGMFVSFMSGNSTRLGVSLAQGHWSNAAQAIGVIALFVTGAAAGSLIVYTRASRSQGWVLLVEASLLVAAALFHALGAPVLAIAAMVLAMGLENAVFQAEGGTSLGLTYITGALVKVGQLAAAALTGGRRWAWLPNLLLWAALVAGAVAGACAYRWINLSAIWFAAAVALSLAILVFATARRRD
jgi:uncharacterized membrane protein YoaK (UPF0700 family)